MADKKLSRLSEIKTKKSMNKRVKNLAGQDESKVLQTTQKRRPSQPEKRKKTSVQSMIQPAGRLAASDLVLEQREKNHHMETSSKHLTEANLSGGTITSIEAQKRQGRYNLYLNGAFALGISENVLIKFALAKGLVLTTAEVVAIYQSEQQVQAYQLALNFLQPQLRSELEIRQRLEKAAYEEKIIDWVISKLQDLGYVDDLHYGQAFTRTAMNLNRQGPYVIRQKLKMKGISDELIEQSLLEYDEETLYANAYHIASKKMTSLQGKASKRQGEQKLTQQILTKGFPSEIARQVASEISAQYQDDSLEREAFHKAAQKLMRQLKMQGQNPSREQRYRFKQKLYQKGYPRDWIDSYAADFFAEEDV